MPIGRLLDLSMAHRSPRMGSNGFLRGAQRPTRAASGADTTRYRSRADRTTAASPLAGFDSISYTTALYEVVRENIETLYGAIDDGALGVKLPKHAKKELDAY